MIGIKNGAYITLCFVLPWFGMISPPGVGTAALVIGCVLLIALIASERNVPKEVVCRWKWAFLFLGVLWLSLLWSLDASFAAERLVKITFYFIVGGTLISMAPKAPQSAKENAQWALVWGSGIAAGLLFAHVGLAGGLYALINPGASAVDILDAANRPSVILAVCLGAIYVAAGERTSVFRRNALVGAIIVLFFFTRSESAMLAGIVWVLVLGASTYKLAAVRQCVAWGGAAAIMIMPSVFQLVHFLTDGQVTTIRLGSAGARMEIWYAVSNRIFEAPWIGHGIEAARFITDWNQVFFYYKGPHMLHPHNGILQIWLELGFAGAAFAAIAWAILVLKTERLALRHQPPILASIVAFLVVASVSHGLWQSWWVNGVLAVVAITLLVSTAVSPTTSPVQTAQARRE